MTLGHAQHCEASVRARASLRPRSIADRQSPIGDWPLRVKASMTGSFCAVLLALLPFLSAPARADAPAITPEQIEADWLRQDALRAAQAPAAAAPNLPDIKPEQDAAGAVDGKIDGKWGFHTADEENPWWQVDLGSPTALDRVVLYNRCDGGGGFAARAGQIMVLLSDDAKMFQKVYQHDGKSFLGETDKKPLVVKMNGHKARFVRLQVPGKTYFHLDEVQVYEASSGKNIALGRPAMQSSVSAWSAPAAPKADRAPAASPRQAYATQPVIERGLRLAAGLKAIGANVTPHEAALRSAAERLAALPGDAGEQAQRELYLAARWAVRKMALANPLLDFDEVLFVKRAPTLFPHLSDQYYGWWSRPGGGLFVLSGFKGEQPRLRCLTEKFEPGNFLQPDLSYDGKKVLFAYCKYYPHVAGVGDKTQKDKLPEDSFYHLYEMGVDGTGLRRLTRGRYDDFDGRYLPNGDIVFTSTRKGTALQAGWASAAATCEATCPDSYVRCGGDNHRPVAVFTLHRMDRDGDNLRAISAFENFEWTPSVINDGRIVYARWDYIDRFNGHFFSLWATNPDGTNAQLYYGNYTAKPQAVFEARPIPNSDKLVFTASAHHSITGGSLVLLDRNVALEGEPPLTRLTPEVCFPETEGWPRHYYLTPWPLSEEHFLCAWADRPLPPHSLMSAADPRNPPNAAGIYLYDAYGNLNLLYRDEVITSSNPIPVRSRPRPPIIADVVDWDAPAEGRFLLQDAYAGLDGVERGSVARLRIVGVPPKVQPQMNAPNLGVSAEDPGKFVLGTVPVEKDGSAYFRVPTGVPVFFQAIGRDGLAIQTMRSLTYVQPNQTLSCVGCHESRDAAPSVGRVPMAAARAPSKLTPEPEGAWPMRFDMLVQPVLDKHCVSCHSPAAKAQQPHATDLAADSAIKAERAAKAAKFDLSPAHSYKNLLAYGDNDLRKLAHEKDRSVPGQCPASQSKLLALLTRDGGHEGLHLDADSRYRLAVWMDTYAQVLGSFSKQQEDELRQLKQKLAGMLAE